MLNYQYRISREVIWMVVVAVLTPLLLELSQLDFSAIIEVGAWNWAAGIAAAMVRAGAAVLLALIGPGSVSMNDDNEVISTGPGAG